MGRPLTRAVDSVLQRLALAAGLMTVNSRRPRGKRLMRSILHVIGIFLIVAWLVMLLAVKITFAAVHLLLLLGVAFILFGLLRSKGANSTV